MPYEVVGIEHVDKTGDDGRPYSYNILHTVYGKEEFNGMCVEKFYCGSRVDLSEISVGDTVLVLYNKYGKVADVKKTA